MPVQQIESSAAAPLWSPYCGVAPAPGELIARWNLDPVLFAALAVAGAAYVLHRRRGGDSSPVLVGLGALVFLVAFVSPLCALSSALFSARVFHHALLVVVAAPLFAFGLRLRPRIPLVIAAAAHGLLFWFWHAPGPYAFALSVDAAYWAMQASLLGSGVLFWAAVRRSEALPAAGALFFTLMHTGLLGALITFAPAPLYAPHLATTLAWGLTPLSDQQLAGLIMWAPMAFAYLLAALLLVGRSLAPPRPITA